MLAKVQISFAVTPAHPPSEVTSPIELMVGGSN